jgi:hypothetical protein
VELIWLMHKKHAENVIIQSIYISKNLRHFELNVYFQNDKNKQLITFYKFYKKQFYLFIFITKIYIYKW